MELKFPFVVTNVLSTQLFESVNDELITGWSLSNRSNSNQNYNLWGKFDRHELIFLKIGSYLKLKIIRHLKQDIALCKVHINGQLPLQESSFHKDFQEPFFWTCVLFTNRVWNTDWGGEFVCFDPNKQEYKYTPYVPNTAVLIPSNWEHSGRAPNKNTQVMRTTIAFSYVKNINKNEAYRLYGHEPMIYRKF